MSMLRATIAATIADHQFAVTGICLCRAALADTDAGAWREHLTDELAKAIAAITCATCALPIDDDQAWHDVEGLGRVHTSQQGCTESHHREDEATRPVEEHSR